MPNAGVSPRLSASRGAAARDGPALDRDREPELQPGEFVERMLDVTNQSYAPTEHIVRDACSTDDGTTDILHLCG